MDVQPVILIREHENFLTPMSFYKEQNDGIILKIRVIPRASKASIQGVMGDALKIRIQSPPVDGQANAALIKFLAKQWNIPKSKIEILSGTTHRNKRLLITKPSKEMKAELRSLESE
jgi:uncharacterized protein (TIGR00251 family)